MTISPAIFPAVTVTVVRDRKIRTALRTNQIAGFVTVPSWKKIKHVIFTCEDMKFSRESLGRKLTLYFTGVYIIKIIITFCFFQST